MQQDGLRTDVTYRIAPQTACNPAQNHLSLITLGKWQVNGQSSSVCRSPISTTPRSWPSASVYTMSTAPDPTTVLLFIPTPVSCGSLGQTSTFPDTSALTPNRGTPATNKTWPVDQYWVDFDPYDARLGNHGDPPIVPGPGYYVTLWGVAPSGAFGSGEFVSTIWRQHTIVDDAFH